MHEGPGRTAVHVIEMNLGPHGKIIVWRERRLASLSTKDS
jgi:hypothetical protein